MDAPRSAQSELYWKIRALGGGTRDLKSFSPEELWRDSAPAIVHERFRTEELRSLSRPYPLWRSLRASRRCSWLWPKRQPLSGWTSNSTGGARAITFSHGGYVAHVKITRRERGAELIRVVAVAEAALIVA
jgi:hypothetical protein